jgi:hypothetical protein
MSEPSSSTRWPDLLTDEDLAFLKLFLLASGSLKEIATACNVTYPTVRCASTD